MPDVFCPTYRFFDRSTVGNQQIVELLYNRVVSILFYRLNDVHDFVVIHEITSSFGFAPLP